MQQQDSIASRAARFQIAGLASQLELAALLEFARRLCRTPAQHFHARDHWLAGVGKRKSDRAR